MKSEIIQYLNQNHIKNDIYNGGIRFYLGVDTFIIYVKGDNSKRADVVLLHKSIFDRTHKKDKIYEDFIDYHIQKEFKGVKNGVGCVIYALRHSGKWETKRYGN